MSAVGKRLLGMLSALGSPLDTNVQAGGGPRLAPREPAPVHELVAGQYALVRETVRARWHPRARYFCTKCWGRGTADDFRTMRCARWP